MSQLPAYLAQPQSLSGAAVDFEALPVAAITDRVKPWLDDVAFTDVACGFADGDVAQALAHHLQHEPLVRLWRARYRGVARHEEAWVVYSGVTSNHCIALYQPHPSPRGNDLLGLLQGLTEEQSVQLYGDMLEVFTAPLFGETACESVLSHVALPVAPLIYATYVEHGWDVVSTRLLGRAEPRYVFVVERAVFELYHAPVADADDLL